ncbi:MAG TPA: SH3 domain-containing protein [Polyangiaceae bacterium]|jgi:hypothetical protein|nr:SH3 domain-containing protein [Polyangiaceae bacterium]
MVPSAEADRPSWFKVGAIAAIGFAVGVVWPRLAGVRLGPNLPETTASPAASAASANASAPSTTASGDLQALSTTTPALPSASPAPVAAAQPVHVNVAHGSVSTCRTSSGESLRAAECGSLPGLDAIVIPRLHKLADCPAASGVSGRLNLSLHVDFDHGVSAALGRGHGLSSPEPLLACANAALAGAGLASVAHDYSKYSVAYGVTFSDSQPAATAPGAASATATADGTALVEWEMAIVRDAPKTGKVVARLQRGTSLRIGSAKDGWYPVKYGDGYASDGWVYRGAIGR